jgi:peptidoglycan/LPS O-acetylase OafA/YrhL
MLATLARAEKPAPQSRLLPVFAVLFGILICVLAEVWQPAWLRSLCSSPTYLLFPGQFAPMQQKTFGAILVLIGIIHLDTARHFLSRPWLVARSKLSFPLYLIHWPVLFGPCAALFVTLNGAFGLEWARLCTIVVGIGLAFAAATLYLPIDRRALGWSRALREGLSGRSARWRRSAPLQAQAAE